MSAYSNLVQDFPTRCVEIYHLCKRKAAEQDLEVTLLCSTAASAFVVPYERLRRDMNSMPIHPSGDGKSFAGVSETMNSELDERCCESRLLREICEDWTHEEVQKVEGDPEAWGLGRAPKTINQKKTGTVLKILRNALAHGNIWATGKPTIDKLVFVSSIWDERAGRVVGYRCLTCPPAKLAQFLDNWVAFLREEELVLGAFLESRYDDAA